MQPTQLQELQSLFRLKITFSASDDYGQLQELTKATCVFSSIKQFLELMPNGWVQTPRRSPIYKKKTWVLVGNFEKNPSLRSERFCGVREQRITARKMERVKEGGGGGEGFLPSPLPTPPFFLWALAPFSAQTKHRKSRSSVFLCFQLHGDACYAG